MTAETTAASATASTTAAAMVVAPVAAVESSIVRTSVWTALESAMAEVKGLDEAAKSKIRFQLETALLSIPDFASADMIEVATLSGRLHSHHAPYGQHSQTVLSKHAMLMLGTPNGTYSVSTPALCISSPISIYATSAPASKVKR